MLGTLATIYRNRASKSLADAKMCLDILALDERLIIREKEIIYAASENETQENIVGIDIGTYKFNRIKINLWRDLWASKLEELQTIRGDFFAIAPYFRKIMEYELSNGLCEYSDALKYIKKPVTLVALNGLTASQFQRMLLLDHKETQRLRDLNDTMRNNSSFRQHMFRIDPRFSFDDPQTLRCTLAKCAGCNATEPNLHTFLLCAACKRVKYCSKTIELGET